MEHKIINYLKFPNINPIILDIGFVSVKWYGVMYLLGFYITSYLVKKRINNLYKNFKYKEINFLLHLCFISAVIGGRIGYVILYNLHYFKNNPICLFKIWEGGMSFHGGLIGVILSLVYLSYRNNINFFKISDIVAQSVPLSIGLGRIGNFINCELWGRVAINIPWAMLFPNAIVDDLIYISKNLECSDIYEKYGALPRHPSQIYEMLFEGIILFLILNTKKSRFNFHGKISGLFLIYYGTFRFILEFFRQPDIQIGLLYGISMGQILSIPMILFGIILIKKLKKNKEI